MKQRTKSGRVDGLVIAYRVRKTYTGSWAHDYNVDGAWYTHFSSLDFALLRVGDRVRFSATERRTQRHGTRYFSIAEDSIELIDLPEGSDEEVLGGYVYVLINGAMKGLCKIGFTRTTPQERAKELSASTGVPLPFEVAFSLWVKGDPAKVEKIAHAALSNRRARKEFFRVSVEKASAAVQQAYSDAYRDRVENLNAAIVERIKKDDEQRDQAINAIIEKRRDEERRRWESSPVGRWMRSGILVARVFSEFSENNFEVDGRTFWRRLWDGPLPKPDAVNIELRALDGEPKRLQWVVSAEGWLRGQEVRLRKNALLFGDAVATLAGLDGGARIERVNLSLEIPSRLLAELKEPDASQVRDEGGEVVVYGHEVSQFALAEGPLIDLCNALCGALGRPSINPPTSQTTETAPGSAKPRQAAKDSKGRERYPFGSKDSARPLLRKSGMTDAEIDAYLDQFAD